MGPAEWGMLLFLSLLWGGSFLFVGVAVSELPTLTIVFARVGLAAVALWVVILVTGRPLPRDHLAWLAFLAMGLLNNVLPFGLIVWGQHSIASGLASILNASTPLFAVLVAGIVLHDEPMTGRKLVGVVVGFVGVVVMIGVDALSGLGAGILAQVAILGAALSYAFAGVFGRRFKSMGIDPVVTAAGQVTGSTLILLPITLIVDAPFSLPMPSIGVAASITALALLSTSLAYILYFQILQRAGATNLLLVTFLVPVSAILLGALFLGERLEWIHFVGMVLIGLGLAAIDGRLFKPSRSNR
ncbi:EamA family transporter [Cohaesibacter celericrescens]|uniref:EamA family transporter n=2 Tax=Cohaesibacter celericrescens TaxID=2067669 RepID=A0A2N5XMH5_9HYPH|nr:EamA family transporter [Cohaesibacter celericrescens]